MAGSAPGDLGDATCRTVDCYRHARIALDCDGDVLSAGLAGAYEHTDEETDRQVDDLTFDFVEIEVHGDSLSFVETRHGYETVPAIDPVLALERAKELGRTMPCRWFTRFTARRLEL